MAICVATGQDSRVDEQVVADLARKMLINCFLLIEHINFERRNIKRSENL